ncbi:MAG: ATP cone domain-containing protein [Fluviicola sp.]|nr:ATP cone domain-containing protein [Fluviicola sp.]
MHNQLFVTKASGEQNPFSEEKIRASLRRSGADEEQIDSILHEVKQQLYDGIATKQIYRIAFALLKSGSRHLAARYHLKDAIMELGPSGFPFEKYVAELMKFQGYTTKVGQFMQGKCVTHEIDVVAKKGDELLLIECKYHNQQGISCNIKIPLYIHSRFNDVKAQELQKPEYASLKQQVCIVTNTRFTEDALQYAGCSGIEILGWDRPFKKGLKELIDQSGLYPVTCLTSLTIAEKRRLLDRETVLCNQLITNKHLLESIGIKSGRIKTVLDEANRLCRETAIDKGVSER